MKRSEMVDILFNSMNTHFTYYGDEGWSADYDLILKDLEEAGMIPPATRNFRLPPEMNRYALADELAKYSVYGYSGPYYGMKYDINEWEPEDG